ncbi:MAG: DMT family transporter [Alphaproteobacteria bacterium]
MRILAPPVKGALFALSAAAVFVTVHAAVSQVGRDLHPFEATFFRNFFGLIALTPWMAMRGTFRRMATSHMPRHLLRVTTNFASSACWFWGLSILPLATATALSFTAPLFVTMMAPFALGERVGWRRIGAVLFGFAGAMVILRPGVIPLELGSVLVLVSAIIGAISVLYMKKLAGTENPDAMVAWLLLLSLPLSLALSLPFWVWPSTELWLLGGFIGLGATTAHLLIVRGFALADASFLQPFDYARLPFAALLGLIFFAQRPDVWTAVGGVMIVGAALYITRREARMKKRTTAPAAERVT